MLVIIQNQIAEIAASPYALVFVIFLCAACAIAVRSTPQNWNKEEQGDE